MDPNHLEIERKAWVDDPEALAERLACLGTQVGEIVKQDRYYLLGHVPPEPIDFGSDPIFRVRLVGDEAVLGYKSRRFDGTTEINEETEIALGAKDPVLRWLEAYLGQAPFVIKHKHTRLYRLHGPLSAAAVELNHVRDLGHFIEVEVMSTQPDTRTAIETIDEIFALLEIPESRVEPRYYIDLLMLKQG
jgi:predicted adenylyl cyclase CyaB